MKLIVKADDLGWSDGINAGIEKSVRDGIVTASGCMTNMPAARRGIELIQRYNNVSIGQHTNITVGKPISRPEQIPHLVDKENNFNSSSYYRKLKKSQEDVLPYYDEIVIEIEAQLKRFIDYAGCRPAFLEGHAIPSKTFEKALKYVADKNNIIYADARNINNKYKIFCPPANEYLLNAIKENRRYSQFEINVEEYIINDLNLILDKETALLVFHSGFVDSIIMETSSINGLRMRECEALCSIRLREWITDHGVELINYSQLSDKSETEL